MREPRRYALDRGRKRAQRCLSHLFQALLDDTNIDIDGSIDIDSSGDARSTIPSSAGFTQDKLDRSLRAPNNHW